MGLRTSTTTLAILALIATAAAQQSCNATTHCGEDAPCCSEFGFCGTGTYCLGGCNPLLSHELTSCSPEPVCTDKTYTFATMDRIVNSTLYNGNSSKYDWTIDGGVPALTQSNELVLTLTDSTGNAAAGTKVSSTEYIHYGTITTTMKSGQWKGVVAAFITMSNVHDEIDWEWPGLDHAEAQSNIFWLGVANYTAGNGKTHNVSSSTFSNYHDYTIDWQPDALTFKIDGAVVRTVQKTDTLNQATGAYEYPTTPARVQLSIWPAGIPGVAQGTVDWADGMIDWTDKDYVSAGHFYALVKQVKIQCSTQAPLPAGAVSYVYGTNDSHNIPSVLVTNQSTVSAALPLRGLFAGRVVAALVLAAGVALLGAAL